MYLSVLFGTGLACATAQAFFTLLFARLLPDGIWRREPGFLAHQAVGLPLMLIVAGVGTVAWFFPDEASQKLAATPEGRVHGDFPTSDWLVSLLLGELLLWDIPMSAFPSLRSAASVGHHVMMALACVIALQPYLLYYVPFQGGGGALRQVAVHRAVREQVPFFGGVIELSSIPLQVVDVLHPKHFVEWTERPRVAQLNAACRVAFAALFLLTRTALFPFVVFGQAATRHATHPPPLSLPPEARPPPGPARPLPRRLSRPGRASRRGGRQRPRRRLPAAAALLVAPYPQADPQEERRRGRQQGLDPESRGGVESSDSVLPAGRRQRS